MLHEARAPYITFPLTRTPDAVHSQLGTATCPTCLAKTLHSQNHEIRTIHQKPLARTTALAPLLQRHAPDNLHMQPTGTPAPHGRPLLTQSSASAQIARQHITL